MHPVDPPDTGSFMLEAVNESRAGWGCSTEYLGGWKEAGEVEVGEVMRDGGRGEGYRGTWRIEERWSSVTAGWLARKPT